MPEGPTTIAGKYTLIRKLASGGMAEVFLARQIALAGFEKLVVLKRILPHLAEQQGFVQMFLDEARTAADLRHPNVVDVYEVGTDAGTYFIAMEFLHGQHLRAVVEAAGKRHLKIPLGVAVQIVIEAARGLHYAHEKRDLRGQPLGIVHRDVSPHNIVISYDGNTKIVDFGIAKARNQVSATAPGVVKGKVAYLSPEQASGKSLDGRSDLFSLAVVLWELTTGRRLFRRETDLATIRAVLDREITPPTEIIPGYPPELEAVLLRALSAESDDRQPDCATFAHQLHEVAQRLSLHTTPEAVSELMHELFSDQIREESGDVPAYIEPDESAEAPTSFSPSPSWQTVADTRINAESSQALAPRGLVTLVFTDIEGSTNIWERHPESMELALELHNAVLRESLLSVGGYEVKTEGDAFMAAFPDALAGVRWCLEVQKRLMELPWPEQILAHRRAGTVTTDDGKTLFKGLRVRMGVHVGRPACQPNPVTGRMDYFGPTVNRAARVADAAHGGQVLVTSWVMHEIEHELAELESPTTRDLGEHRLKGLDTAIHIYQVLPEDLAEREFPSLRTLETRRTNLSPHPVRFVGRARDLKEIHELVSKGTRLITLQGPGGTGKTRLAMEYGWTHQDDFAADGGIWFFDLTQARSVDGICSAVGNALSVPLVSGNTADDMVEQLGHALASRGRTLLIFDNFEQVVEHGAATLKHWLSMAPQAQLLVTSQATLKLPGEVIHELAPLEIPDDDDAARASESVQLFVERARAARPNFEPSDEDTAIIAQIVRQLDGLPLAIELAAARIKVLTPAKLLDRLSRRFDLLKGARRDAADRQATLRGAIDWSWNMLQPWEQSALAQCSIFRGGFTLEAAEEVLDLSEHDEAPLVMDVIQDLRERSLLRTYEPSEAAGELRFSMYESVREYTAEKLRELDALDDAALARRHASFYLNTCAEWAQIIESESDVERMEELQLEIDNLVAIHERALARQGSAESAAQAVRAALAMDPVLSRRGPFNIHLQILDATLEHVRDSDVFDGLLCRLHIARGRARRARGQLAEAQADFERALELAQATGDSRQQGMSLGLLGTVLQYQGHYEQARDHYAQALEQLRSAGETRFKGIVLGSLGVYHHEQGRMSEAQTLYEQALELLRQSGDRYSEAVYVGNLGMAHHEAGQLERAQQYYEQSLAIHRSVGARRHEARVLGYLATLHHDSGDDASAARHYEQSLSLLRDVGDRRSTGMYTGYYAALIHATGDVTRARELYDEALVVLRDVGYRRFEGLFEGFDAAARAQVEDPDAQKNLDEAVKILEQVGDPVLLEALDLLRGVLEAARGDLDPAKKRLDADRPDSADIRFARRVLVQSLSHR